MKWKVGDKVISNLGIDKDKHLTIDKIEYNRIWFSDGESVLSINIGDDLVLAYTSWREKYGHKTTR